MSTPIEDQVAAHTAAITSLNTASAGLVQAQAAVESVIPSQASAANKLADKAFVNSTINSLAAFYITADAAGNPFATRAALMSATTFYSGGTLRVPTRNDYALVLADEAHDGAATRYIYENGWQFQFVVNSSGLTAEQYNAVMSGITGLGVPAPGASGGVAATAAGVWSQLWGSLAALPQGFSSLYDFVNGVFVPFTKAVATALTEAQRRQFCSNFGGVYLKNGKLYDGSGNEVQVGGGGGGNMKIWGVQYGNATATTVSAIYEETMCKTLQITDAAATGSPVSIGDFIVIDENYFEASVNSIMLDGGPNSEYHVTFALGDTSSLTHLYGMHLYYVYALTADYMILKDMTDPGSDADMSATPF